MQQTPTRIINKPAWVDLGTKDPTAARDFYGKLFGWKTEVNPDPQYGGYGLAKLDGQDTAGIGGLQSPDQPTAWSFYIGTDDCATIEQKVKAAGGKVVAPAFDVGDQGKMATFQDPSGAFISVWQPTRMGGFQTEGANAFGWAELNARGVEKDVSFYERVFGWTPKRSPVPGGSDYIEFQVDGDSVAGATEIDPKMPSQVPSHWLVYFSVDDVQTAFQKALQLGAREIVAPQAYEGGEFAIVTDPQGAQFGLYKSSRR